jgi:hypothetical protein
MDNIPLIVGDFCEYTMGLGAVVPLILPQISVWKYGNRGQEKKYKG